MKEQQSPSSIDKTKQSLESAEPKKETIAEEEETASKETTGKETASKETVQPQQVQNSKGVESEDRPTGRIKEIIIEVDKEQPQRSSTKRPSGKKQDSKSKGVFGLFGARKKTKEVENAKNPEDQRDKKRYEQYMKNLEESGGQTSLDQEESLGRTGSHKELDTYYYKEESEKKEGDEKKRIHPDLRKKKQEDPGETRKKPARKAKPSDTKSIRIKPGLNLFRIIELVVLVVLLASVGFVGKYIYDYMHTNSLTAVKEGKKTAGENADFPRDINPFELFSSRKPDLIATFGEPIKEGEDELTQERYMYYEYEWFKSPAAAQVFYGKEQRVYQINVQFKADNMDAMKEKMEKTLGIPWQSTDPVQEATASASASVSVSTTASPSASVSVSTTASPSAPSDHPRFIKWIKDSVSYTLTEGEDQKAHLKMILALYPNINDLEVGINPTMIERHDGEDYTGDGKPDSIILLGDKANFTDYYYTNLYILIWDGTRTLVAKFPPSMDGGVMPQMEAIPVQGQAPKLLITSTNNAAKNYNVFQVQNDAIVNLYSSNDAPKDLKK